ncbi:MAG: ABC transporter ATP-binding protein [Steroidobacteraceae bacterium]
MLQKQTMPSLEIADLHLAYGSVAALTGINLAVARGEFIALLGPSGCGKTSLLRSIAGFVHPQRGAIRLNGRDVAGLPARHRNIGLMFQSYALFPHMTALENVRFGLECRRVPKREADERSRGALTLVGLEHLSERRPRQLSGGQQQRVALARAIVIEPDILLLDEPLAAIDKQLRTQMQNELRLLQRRLGVTAVFVTHDQEEAMSMADRIVVMRDGEIQQLGAPEQLFVNPSSAWVCDFIGAGNLLQGRFERSAEGTVRLSVGPGSVFEAAAPIGEDVANKVLFVPFDRIKLTRTSEADGLAITAQRYLGLAVELQIAYSGGIIRTQLPMNIAGEFPMGCHVRVTADRSDCRLLRNT